MRKERYVIITDKDAELEKVISFYRSYPDKFAEDFLNVKLFKYQKYYLRLLGKIHKKKNNANKDDLMRTCIQYKELKDFYRELEKDIDVIRWNDIKVKVPNGFVVVYMNEHDKKPRIRLSTYNATDWIFDGCYLTKNQTIKGRNHSVVATKAILDMLSVRDEVLQKISRIKNDTKIVFKNNSYIKVITASNTARAKMKNNFIEFKKAKNTYVNHKHSHLLISQFYDNLQRHKNVIMQRSIKLTSPSFNVSVYIDKYSGALKVKLESKLESTPLYRQRKNLIDWEIDGKFIIGYSKKLDGSVDVARLGMDYFDADTPKPAKTLKDERFIADLYATIIEDVNKIKNDIFDEIKIRVTADVCERNRRLNEIGGLNEKAFKMEYESIWVEDKENKTI